MKKKNTNHTVHGALALVPGTTRGTGHSARKGLARCMPDKVSETQRPSFRVSHTSENIHEPCRLVHAVGTKRSQILFETNQRLQLSSIDARLASPTLPSSMLCKVCCPLEQCDCYSIRYGLTQKKKPSPRIERRRARCELGAQLWTCYGPRFFCVCGPYRKEHAHYQFDEVLPPAAHFE